MKTKLFLLFTVINYLVLGAVNFEVYAKDSTSDTLRYLNKKNDLHKKSSALKKELEILEILHLAPKEKLTNINQLEYSNLDCIQWVYESPSASREQAIEACRGVSSLECAKWVYESPSASRIDSAKACAGVVDMKCVHWAYQSPSVGRVEAAQSCGYNPNPIPDEPQC